MARNQRLNATITIGGALNKSVGKAFGSLKGGLEGVASEIKDVTAQQKELSKQRKVLERQGQSVEALDREYEELGRTLDALQRKQARYEHAAVASARVGDRFRDTMGEIGRVSRAASFAIGATATAAFGVASSTADAAREVQLAAEVANAGTTEFQRMAAAAETVGIEQDKLGDILKDVNDRVGDFLETGGGPMADFFENIGPKVGVTAKHFKDLSGPEALQLYVSSLEKAGLSQQQMTFYLEAMASDATALIPLLRDNGAEMNRLGYEAEQMGRILSEDAIASASRFRTELRRMGYGFTGLRNIVGTAVMPVVSDAMSEISDYLVENREDVDALADAFADRLGAALPIAVDLASGLGQVATQAGAVTARVADMVGGWENLGIVIGAALGVKTALKIGGLIGSVVRLAGAVARLTGGTAVAGAAFGTMGGTIGRVMASATKVVKSKAAIMTAALRAIPFISLVQGVHNLPSDPTELGNVIQRNREQTEQGLRNAPVIGGMMRAYDGAVGWVHGSDDAPEPEAPAPAEQPAAPGRPSPRPTPGAAPMSAERPMGRPAPGDELQRRARGGEYKRGWRLVGEEGAETEFMSRGGFIATARETKRLAQMGERARLAFSRIGGAIARAGAERGASGSVGFEGRIGAALDRVMSAAEAGLRAVSPRVPEAPAGERSISARPQAAAPAPVTQNITIHAAGMSVQQLVAELERRRRDVSGAALYDGMTDFGQYGRGFV